MILKICTIAEARTSAANLLQRFRPRSAVVHETKPPRSRRRLHLGKFLIEKLRRGPEIPVPDRR